MSKESYLKWHTEPDASLGNTDKWLWLGGQYEHPVWNEINQYLPSKLDEQDSQDYGVTTKYIEAFDGIELVFGDDGKSWGSVLSVMAQQVVFKLTNDDKLLKAELREGLNLHGVPRGFELSEWTLNYVWKKSEGDPAVAPIPTGEVSMIWNYKGDGGDQPQKLLWNYSPYISK